MEATKTDTWDTEIEDRRRDHQERITRIEESLESENPDFLKVFQEKIFPIFDNTSVSEPDSLQKKTLDRMFFTTLCALLDPTQTGREERLVPVALKVITELQKFPKTIAKNPSGISYYVVHKERT